MKLNIGTPQNIDNTGLTLLMLSSKKTNKKEGQDVWKMLLKKYKKSGSHFKEKGTYNHFLRF